MRSLLARRAKSVADEALLRVSALAGGAGGTGVLPSASFIVNVNKGGNDATGDGTDEKPYLTIAKGFAVAKAIGAGVVVLLGPGDYSAENPALPPLVSLMPVDLSGDLTVTGNITLDAAAWAVAGATSPAAIGQIVVGNITFNCTGFNDPLLTLVGTNVTGSLTFTADPTTGGELFVGFETEIVGAITIVGGTFETHGLVFDSTLHLASSATQLVDWVALGCTSFTPTTVTLDASAGQPATASVFSTSYSGTLHLIDGGGGATSYQSSAGGIPSTVTLTGGAAAPVALSPLVGLNSKLPSGANAALGTQATADGAGGITWT